jgi:hypothetical protein
MTNKELSENSQRVHIFETAFCFFYEMIHIHLLAVLFKKFNILFVFINMITLVLSAYYRISGLEYSSERSNVGMGIFVSLITVALIMSMVVYFTVSFNNVNEYQLQLVSRIFEKMKEKNASSNKF